ncbi:hypothetical protein CLV35_0158 [Motilibacter peucedani]|uniref:DUF1508 domain-containing protein n=1 Tax=Motilibacter peucedani TaxID=598650 RepID=A0A420XV07_9ACTN|nr:hypothetical protein [Motilibacter peucedani]RKS80692.1 hypothetical protein CLV35_0158 [Motilibacter peucedani]
MEAVTVFRDSGGWFWSLQHDEEVLGRSPTYPTRDLALESARTARVVAARAEVRLDASARD